MSTIIARISIWSNNPHLQSLLIQSSYNPSLQFSDYKKTSTNPYVLAIIQLNKDLGDISQRLISIYDHCRIKNQKLSVVIVHGETVFREKNLYFTQLLDQLGGGSPVHRLVFVKDIYHESLLDSETWLESYILESLLTKKINISSKGENQLYPLSVRDFITGLQKILFLSSTSGKAFWMVGDSITDLDLAYLIKKNLEDSDEQYEIEATAANYLGSDLTSLGNQSRASLNWEPVGDFSMDLRRAIQRLDEDRSKLMTSLHHLDIASKQTNFFKLTKTREFLEKLLDRYKHKKGRLKAIENSSELIKKIFEYSLALVALVYLLVTVSFITFTSMSLINQEKSLNFARNADTSSSVKALTVSSTFAKIGESSYSFVSPVFSLLAPTFHEKNHNLFVFLHYSQSSLENLQQTVSLAEKIYESLGNPSININYNDASLALRSNLSQIYENINQIRLITEKGKLPAFLENKLEASPEFKNISLIEQQVTQILKSSELIPAFLVGDSPKNVVILFQNSNELRSTGGVVDYLLALVMEQGRVVSRNIYNASEIDNLLTTKISAPPLINLYTGLESWQTRDLNYNPDFSLTASNFSAVIEQSLKFKPDIILAVNESLMVSLLEEDKGILLNGQNITSEIFKVELPKTSPNPLYSQLIDHYLDKIFNHRLSLLSLGRVIAKQSLENQILFWSVDDNIEKTIVGQSFSGVIFPHVCNSAIPGSVSCLAETTYLNESNFALVPVGSDLKKKVTHTVTFAQDSVVHEYLIDYQFTKEFNNLNRDLNEIIQLYAPTASTLEEVGVNGKNVASNSIQRQQHGPLERFEIPISLKFNIDNHITIKFISPLTGIFRLPFAYSITEYRQPGVSPNNGNIDLVIKTPDSARAALITSPAVSLPGSFTYTYPPTTSSFGISFEPKHP